MQYSHQLYLCLSLSCLLYDVLYILIGKLFCVSVLMGLFMLITFFPVCAVINGKVRVRIELGLLPLRTFGLSIRLFDMLTTLVGRDLIWC